MWTNFLNGFVFRISQFLRNLLSSSLLLLVSVFCICLLFSSVAFGRVLTKEEVANFMLNGYGTQSSAVTETMINNVNSRMGTWQSIADLTSQYEGKYSIGYNYRTKIFFFVYYTGSTNALNNQYTTSVMFSNNNAYIGRYSSMANNLSLTYNYYNYDLVNDNLTNSSVTNGSVNNTCFGYSNTNIYWIYTDRYISYSTSFGISAHGQKPTGTDLFAENYISSVQFDFEPTTNYRATISGDTSGYQYYVISKTFANTLFGTFTDSSYLDSVYINFRAYQSGEGWQDLYSSTYDCSNNKVGDYFYTYDNNDVQSSDFKFKSNSLASNSVVSFVFSPNTTDLSEKAYSFFIKNDKTIINNGVIDIEATINNDSNYVNEINQSLENEQNNQNSNNIQDIVNDLTNDDEINGMVSEYFPSGENSTIASNMGYFNFYNPFLDFFDTICLGIKDVMLGTGNVSLDLNHHGTINWIINSDDFIIPNTTIRIFVAAVVNFFIILFVATLFYEMIFHIIIGEIGPIFNFVKNKGLSLVKFL